jgi:hypothetical protein
VTRRNAVIVAALAVAVIVAAAAQWRHALLDTRPLLPLRFAHADHRDVNCVKCHHNFADDTGEGLCIDCHKTRETIRSHIEPMFHTLCRGCHLATHAKGADAGPVRRCSDCHTPDDAP